MRVVVDPLVAIWRQLGVQERERGREGTKNTVHVYSVNRFMRHPAAIAHVTGWCIGGPCGSVCDRRESRRYTSDTACHWMVYRWSLWICL